MEKKFVIRCRGIILDKGQLLVVEHTGKEGVMVLPGGHLEWGEDIKTGMVRELEEELGVTPTLGDLLCIHNYIQANGKHAVEFFFAVTNASDYRTLGENPSHAYELSSVEWVEPHDERLMRPVGVWEDFKNGTLGDGKLRFLAEGVI